MPANAELNLFATASGLAFLAFQEERFVLELIADLRQSEYWTASRFGVTPGWLLAELATTRRLGYAKRRVTQGRAGGWDAIAVPIFQARAPIGGLTITWDRKLMSPERFADLHLRALQTAAEAISEDVTAG